MTTSINPEKLNLLDAIHLDEGAHSDFDDGHCAMEVVAWLADEGHTDSPTCASTILRRYTIALNDRWSTEQRQALKPYLVRMIGTGNDGKDAARQRIATRWVTTRLLPDWLRLAGMDDQIAALDAVDLNSPAALRKALHAVRDAAWEKRREHRKLIEQRVREELEKQGKPAAVAVAAADAVAVAVAAAVADAAAAAVAAAVADAVAAAVAAAVAVAAADAVAVAVAAADAAAAAAADAAADLTPGTPAWWKIREAAYQAARKVYDTSPALDQVRALGALQEPQALELLDLLIDAREE